MQRFVSVALVVAVAVLSACSGFELDPVPSGPPVQMTRLRAEPYSYTYYSGMKTFERLVVRDAAAWQMVWTQIHAGRTPVIPPPTVDFSREMVVVAAMGEFSTGGYGILLERAIEDRTAGIAIFVRSTSPGSNCGVTLAFSAPVDIAMLPLHPGPVRFIERSETMVC